jgi:hypothetical protein
MEMLNILGALGLSYLAGSGLTTNTAIVGRGLLRAARRAVEGDFRQASVEAAGALVAPALMAFAATAGLVLDVAGGAFALVRPVLREVEAGLPSRGAA